MTSDEITPIAIRKLQDSIKGEIILPDDRRYEKARRVWNHAVDRRPALIARCVENTDVVRAIEFARENELVAAVRSGGHSFAGHGVCDGGIVIDLSFMKRVEIDALGTTLRIQSGVLNGELDHVTNAFEMAIPLGSCPSVGVAGYALGGGESALTPKFGFACDSMTGAEVVTADGRILTANHHENQDLFWALRGAGANFGVVTSMDFRLHRIGKVIAGHLKYPIRQARDVLRFLNQYSTSIPDELFLLAAMLPFPGERMLDIAVVWSGEEKEGERVLQPLRTFMKPFEDSIKLKTYLEEQQGGSDSPSDGDYSSCRRGGHFELLEAPIIDVIAEFAASAPSEASGITMMYWHGPWCSQPHDNAFGFRRVGYEYWVHAYWQDDSEREKSTRWVLDFFAALKPHSTGAVYVNDLENEGDDRVRAAYGEKYDRLAALKHKYDPDNFFRVNQNVKPAH
jgi:FAD/FMN-containing dehydrogenase